MLGSSFAVLLASGCYTYTPVEYTAIRPQEDVQVRITEPAAKRLVKEFGAYTGQLEGQFAFQGSDSASVSVAIGRAAGGIALESTRQTLFLGRTEIVEVRRRQLSRGRTAIAGAGVLAAFALAVRAVVQLGDPNPSPEEGPPVPPTGVSGAIRIPIR